MFTHEAFGRLARDGGRMQFHVARAEARKVGRGAVRERLHSYKWHRSIEFQCAIATLQSAANNVRVRTFKLEPRA